MDAVTKQLLEELKFKTGEKLDLENHHYFLFLEDGVLDIYKDTDEKEIKIEINLSDGIKVYHSDLSVVDLIKNS